MYQVDGQMDQSDMLATNRPKAAAFNVQPAHERRTDDDKEPHRQAGDPERPRPAPDTCQISKPAPGQSRKEKRGSPARSPCV